MLLFMIFLILACLLLLKLIMKPSDSTPKTQNDEYLLEIINRQLLILEVMKQSKLVGDEQTRMAVMNNEYSGEFPNEECGRFTSIYPDKLMILGIAGINYRGNLKSYVGDFKGVLVPEPKNDYDPNAIKIVCEDGKHLGYIAESMTQEVRDFIGVKGSDWRHSITGIIDECQDGDEDDRKFFAGTIYIVKS